jgi:hypothetical protein
VDLDVLPPIPEGGGTAVQKSLEEVEAIVREKICSVCSDRTVDGDCGLENRSDCSLFEKFPHVAKAILSVSSDKLEDYIQAVRDQVCSTCERQADDDSCQFRDEVRCALNAYLLLIVDTIEEASGKTFDRTHVPPLGGGSTVRPEALD